MSDNTQLSTPVGAGDTFRTLEDGSSIKWPVGVTAYATSVGTPDTLQIVTASAGLPVQAQTGASFPVTDNSGSLTVDDGAGSLTVDAPVGTPVFVRLSDGSAAISTLPVSAAALPLPLGAATAAKQPALGTAGSASSDVLTVQGVASMTPLQVADNGSTLSVDDGGASLTVDGTVAATQSGTWNVGTVTSVTSAVAVTDNGSTLSVDDGGGSLTVDGSVSVSGLVPGTSATSLGKAEDAVAADGDTGVAVWAVRKDTAATTVGADGDYHPFEVDGSGRLWVNGSSVTQPVSDAGGSLTVDGTVAVTQATAANLNCTEASAATIATNTGNSATSLGVIDDWDESDRAKVNPIVGQAGVAAGAGAVGATVQRMTLASDDPAVAALQIMDDWDNAASDGASVSGDVAHDAADAGEPVKQGFKATTSLSGLTLVANADRTDGFAGIDGVQITRPHCNLEDIVSGNASNTDGTSTQVIAAAGAGVKQYLTSVILTNTSAAMIYVEMKSGTTVKATIPVPATGGAIFNPPVPLPPNAANEAWNFDPSAATTTVICSAVGFKSKV